MPFKEQSPLPLSKGRTGGDVTLDGMSRPLVVLHVDGPEARLALVLVVRVMIGLDVEAFLPSPAYLAV